MFNNNPKNAAINAELNKFLYEAATEYTQMDFYRKLVEFQNDPNSAVSSQSSYILAAPPTLDGLLRNASNTNYTFDKICTPLGGISNFNSSEAKNLMPMGEIGSSLMRMAPTDAVYNLSLGRLFTSHSNLKSALFKWVFTVAEATQGGKIYMGRAPGVSGSPYFSGLDSELYGIPFGLIGVHCDAAGNFVGADFYEMCSMNSYGRGFQSQSVVIIDNASCYVCAVVPLVSSNGNTHPSLKGSASVNGDNPFNTPFQKAT
jgi:hypothetical protein